MPSRSTSGWYNHHIKKGYRINYKCYNTIAKSVIQCHNETTNIWSHLIGAVLFIALLFMVLRSPDTRTALGWASKQYLGGQAVIGGSDTTNNIFYMISHLAEQNCNGVSRNTPFDMRNQFSKLFNLTLFTDAPVEKFL